jgi:hypothetical protein
MSWKERNNNFLSRCFFQKIEKQTMSTIDDPQPSTSSAPDIIQPPTSSSASPASPFEVPGSPEADDPPSDPQ